MSTEAPEISRHVAVDRWVQYTGEPVEHATDYWQYGLVLHNHGLDADEARYCPAVDVVLVRKDTHLTTVIDNEPGIRPATARAIERAVIRADRGETETETPGVDQ